MASPRQAGGPYGRGNFRFTWYGAKVAGQVDAAVEQALEETAEAAKAEAQARARVDTGRMRDSIEAQVDTTGSGRRRMVLSIGVPYGIFNELGTARMPAQPMIRPSIDIEAPKLRERIRAALAGAR